MDLLATQICPVMLQMAQQLLAQNVNFTVAGELVKLAIKIFFSVCRLQMPASMQNPQALQAWLGMMNTALLKDVSSLPERPTDPDERNEWSWWKVKKWVIKTWHTLFNRYGNPHYVEEDMRPFAVFWSSQVAHHLLGSVMQNLQLRVNGRFCTDRCVMVGLRFLSTSIELGSTFAVIASHLDALVFKLILPVLHFSEADMLLWNENPQEYVRKGYDIAEEYLDPRDAARAFLSDLARLRPWKLFPVLMPPPAQRLQAFAAAPPAQRPYAEKEGILSAIGYLHEYMKDRKDVGHAQLEGLMMTHVLPEFQSQGFLRSRACWVTRHFCDIEWSTEQNRNRVVHAVITCLKDPSFPCASRPRRDSGGSSRRAAKSSSQTSSPSSRSCSRPTSGSWPRWACPTS